MTSTRTTAVQPDPSTIGRPLPFSRPVSGPMWQRCVVSRTHSIARGPRADSGATPHRMPRSQRLAAASWDWRSPRLNGLRILTAEVDCGLVDEASSRERRLGSWRTGWGKHQASAAFGTALAADPVPSGLRERPGTTSTCSPAAVQSVPGRVGECDQCARDDRDPGGGGAGRGRTRRQFVRTVLVHRVPGRAVSPVVWWASCSPGLPAACWPFRSTSGTRWRAGRAVIGCGIPIGRPGIRPLRRLA